MNLHRYFWILPVLAIVLVGCGESEPDAGKSPEQVKQDAGGMDKSALEKKVEEYKGLIAEQQGKLEEIQKQIKELAPTEMMGEKANELKQQLEKVNSYISELQTKLQSYLDELASK